MTEESQYFRKILRFAQNDKNAKIRINHHLLEGRAFQFQQIYFTTKKNQGKELLLFTLKKSVKFYLTT